MYIDPHMEDLEREFEPIQDRYESAQEEIQSAIREVIQEPMVPLSVQEELETAKEQVIEEHSDIHEIPQPYQDVLEERDPTRLLENTRDEIERGIQDCQHMIQMANSPYNRSWVAGVFGADFVDPFVGKVTDYWEYREEELQEQLSVVEELL